MTKNPGDWVADRETLAKAALDQSLSDGAVRALCLAKVGEFTEEQKAWALRFVANLPEKGDCRSP